MRRTIRKVIFGAIGKAKNAAIDATDQANTKPRPLFDEKCVVEAEIHLGYKTGHDHCHDKSHHNRTDKLRRYFHTVTSLTMQRSVPRSGTKALIPIKRPDIRVTHRGYTADVIQRPCG